MLLYESPKPLFGIKQLRTLGMPHDMAFEVVMRKPLPRQAARADLVSSACSIPERQATVIKYCASAGALRRCQNRVALARLLAGKCRRRAVRT